MQNENKPELSVANLEYINKQRATAQAREINRGLTRLKKISSHPEKKPKKTPLDIDKTGSFIVVPLGDLQTTNIEEAVDEASKSCSDLNLPKKAKKKWFKWQAK